MVVVASFTPDKTYTQWKRKSYSIFEVFSFVGGLLGLFAGFSVLSGTEVLYYFLIHPLMELRKRNDSRVYPFEDNNNSIEIKIRRPRILRFIKEMLESSSIHSFSQIGMDGKKFIERF